MTGRTTSSTVALSGISSLCLTSRGPETEHMLIVEPEVHSEDPSTRVRVPVLIFTDIFFFTRISLDQAGEENQLFGQTGPRFQPCIRT